jgi:hypothetical protein
MKLKYFAPLVFFVVPTVIGSVLMWPRAAMKVSLIVGFSIMILSMIMTYVFGLRIVLKDQKLQDRGNEKQ